MKLIAFGAAAVVLAAAAVQAHHSNVTFYDFSRTAEISGTVVQLRLINPHVNLRVEAAGPNGEKAVWIFDGPNASATRANGWHEKVLLPGEAVKVVFRPARNPEFKGGYGEQVVKADGRVLDFGGSLTN